MPGYTARHDAATTDRPAVARRGGTTAVTPVLLFPAGLAALVALAAPLVIHLARDVELRRVEFAALRWLTPRPRPRRRRRFDEWPLLAARLVLLALVALWLARPAVFGAGDTTPYLAVVPGVDASRLPAGDEARRHWLAPGFPALDTPAPTGRVPVASLTRELDAALPPATPLRLVVPATLDGADAERPRLSRAVTWQIADAATASSSAPAPADAAPAGATIAATPPPALSVRVASAQAAAVRYFRAAAVAWASPGHPAAFDAGPPTLPLPPRTTVLVWLLPGPLPPAVVDWIRAGGTALVGVGVATGGGEAEASGDGGVTWRDAVGAPLATTTPLGHGRIVRLTRPLDPALFPELLEPTFAEHLRALLVAPPAAPARVAAVDYAPLIGAATYPQPARDLQAWLALAVAAMLVIERLLATARRPRVAP